MKIKTPPLHSDGCEIYKSDSKIRCNSALQNSLGYIRCEGNDFNQSNLSYILSSVYGNGNGKSILKKHFVDWCMIYTIRKSPIVEFYNNQFQYFEPRNY